MAEPDSIDGLAHFWDLHAARDPMWAVLSDPAKRGRKWEINQFFETGRREISLLLYRLDELGLTPPRSRACDFGCGLGRLSQALGSYFEEVVGVDVSPRMVRLANHLNRYPGRVAYVLNRAGNLRAFRAGHFTLVYSDVVLQHLPPSLTVAYIHEFMRVLNTSGVAVFQLPDKRRALDYLPPRRHPLPEGSYRAGIRVLTSLSLEQEPSQELAVVVEVRNEGTHAWRQASGVIRLGNHWRESATREMVIQDDGRTDMPQLEAGKSCVVTLRMRTPGRSGAFTCEIDLVHEGISWFADQGSQPAYIPIETATRPHHTRLFQNPGEPAVTGAADYGRSDEFYDLLPIGSAVPEEFPMHGVTREEVEAVIAASGGVVRSIEVDERCGPEWIGYRYYVQKLEASDIASTMRALADF